MAKSSSPVRSQMPAGRPSLKGSAGTYDHCDPPFNQPHSLGNGGIPLKFYESHPSGGGRTRSGSGVPSSNLGGPPEVKGATRAREKAKVPGNRK